MTRQKIPAGGRPAGAVGYNQGASILDYIITHNPQPCQASPARVRLARQARRRAERASALWEAARIMGDLEAATYWRRRMLNHQAVYFVLIHPLEATP